MRVTCQTIDMLLSETNKKMRELSDDIALKNHQLNNCRQVLASLLKQKEEMKNATCIDR